MKDIKKSNPKSKNLLRAPKKFKKGSINDKLFQVLADLAKETIKEVKDLTDLLAEYSAQSVVQKFHHIYESNIEEKILAEKRNKEIEAWKALKKLEKLNYLRTNKSRNSFQLTNKGLLKLVKYSLNRRHNRWDKKWRVVIFDINEKKRFYRDALRNRLKWLGFKELQKSVWIFPFNAKREIQEILKISNLPMIGNVRFLTVEKLENDEDLKKEFNLN